MCRAKPPPCTALARLKANQGDVEGAIALYQQSLEIKEKIGDVQGKAATLHQLAMSQSESGGCRGRDRSLSAVFRN